MNGNGGALSGRILLFSLFLLPICALRAEIHEEGTQKSPLFRLFRTNGIRIVTDRDRTRDLLLDIPDHHADPDNLLYLDFETKIPAILTDATGHYSIRSSGYLRTERMRVGTSAAHFSRIDNRVEIEAPAGVWPNTGILGDFTIETWLHPLFLYRKNEIYKRIGLHEGLRRGIDLYIENGVLNCDFLNLLHDTAGEVYTYRLSSRSRIKTDEWVHLAVSYEASTGRLNLLINGKEERVLHAKDGGQIFEMYFHPKDRSPMLIGSTYSGILDDFRIIQRATHEEPNPVHTSYEPLKFDPVSLTTTQRSGSVLSEVIALTPSRYGRLTYKSEEPAGSVLNFWVRYSDRNFAPDTPESTLRWNRIEKSTDDIPPFSYIQWRAELKADPNGLSTPVLKEVSLKYRAVQMPAPPTELRVIPELTGNGRVCLEWRNNPEIMLNNNGAYSIYYGIRPGEYAGRLRYDTSGGSLRPIRRKPIDEMPLTEAERYEKKRDPALISQRLAPFVRQCITNRMIEENIVKMDINMQMPFMKDMNAYYFAVASHVSPREESEPSQPVVAVIKSDPDL
jgi:hypothetical protein